MKHMNKDEDAHTVIRKNILRIMKKQQQRNNKDYYIFTMEQYAIRNNNQETYKKQEHK